MFHAFPHYLNNGVFCRSQDTGRNKHHDPEYLIPSRSSSKTQIGYGCYNDGSDTYWMVHNIQYIFLFNFISCSIFLKVLLSLPIVNIGSLFDSFSPYFLSSTHAQNSNGNHKKLKYGGTFNNILEIVDCIDTLASNENKISYRQFTSTMRTKRLIIR